jgi:P4 family phage/plasmid primase-like protien
MTAFESDDASLTGYLPDVTGMTSADAAAALAAANIRITPVRPGTKDPGSFIGKGWQDRATCDPDTVRDWWSRWPNAGIAMHVGASGFLVIDVDRQDNLPAWMWPILGNAIFRPTTTDPTSKRGHYFFRLKHGQRFGNGLGSLKAPKGKAWGEVRCCGGAVILGPTDHPRTAEGGRYSTGPGGLAPELPTDIANKLNTVAEREEGRELTATELEAGAKAFLALYTDGRDTSALDAILGNFDQEPGARHGSMYDTLCWAMREAKGGCFPAQKAHQELKALWENAIGGQARNGDGDEWNRMVRDAIHTADADGTAEQLWTRAHRNEWPSPNAPLRVAHQMAQRAKAEHRPIAFWAEDWWLWEGPYWRLVGTSEFRRVLYTQLADAIYLRDGQHFAWNPDKAKIDRLVDALKAVVALPHDTTTHSWLDGTNEQVVACANGLVRVADRAVVPHDPKFFNTFALSFDYLPDTTRPVRWERFLSEVFDGDAESVSALQEWFGYTISGRTDLHRMLMVIGPTRSGKGTIDKVLAALVGTANHIGLSSSDLRGDFGLSALLGKTLAVFSDERMSMNSKRFVETLLRITGEDVVTVAEKYKSAWTGRLGVRFMFMSNELPSLPDSSGAIVGRLILLYMPRSFLGREDTGLADQLFAELPAILNWSLDGLERLKRKGEFTSVTSSATLLELIHESASPIRQFVQEWCVLKSGETVAKDDLYKGWKQWCLQTGHEAGAKENLSKKLVAAFGRDLIDPDSRRGGRGGQVRVYTGIALRPRATDVLGSDFATRRLRVVTRAEAVDGG